MQTVTDHLQWIISNADESDFDQLDGDIGNQDPLNRGKFCEGCRLTIPVCAQQFIPPENSKWHLLANFPLPPASTADTTERVRPDNIFNLDTHVQVEIDRELGDMLSYTNTSLVKMQQYFQNLHQSQISRMEQELNVMHGTKAIKTIVKGFNKSCKKAMYKLACPVLMSLDIDADEPRITGPLDFLTTGAQKEVPSKYKQVCNAALYYAFQTPATLKLILPESGSDSDAESKAEKPQAGVSQYICKRATCVIGALTLDTHSKKILCTRCKQTLSRTPSQKNLEVATRLKEKGLSPEDLFRTTGIDKLSIARAGYSVTDLKSLKYNAKTLKAANFSVDDLLSAGWRPMTLRDVFTVDEFITAKEQPDLKKLGIKIKDLSGYTFKNIKAAGFNLSDMVSQGLYTLQMIFDNYKVTVEDCKKEGVSARHFKTFKTTVAELKAGGYSADDLKEAEYPLSQLKEAGYSCEELKKAKYTLYDLSHEFNIDDLKTGGFTLAEVVNSKAFDWSEICDSFKFEEVKDFVDKSSNVNLHDLKDVGYKVAQFLAMEVSLKPLGFSADEFKEAGLTIRDLQTDHKFSPRNLLQCEYSLAELKNAGCNIQHFNEDGYLPQHFKMDGFEAVELKTFGYSVAELKEGKYQVKDLKACEYSVKELKDGGYSVRELKDGGYSVRELKDGGYSAAELKEGKYQVKDLKAGEYSVKELKDGGYSVRELKDGGYSVKELEAGEYSVRELKDGGYSVKDLKDGGYSVKELKAAGYPIEELKAAGYPIEDFKTGNNALKTPKTKVKTNTYIDKLNINMSQSTCKRPRNKNQKQSPLTESLSRR